MKERSGFTLLELMTVMVIMFILMGMGSVAMRGITRGGGVRGATETVRATLSQARQISIMKRKDVYVIFRSEEPEDGGRNGISLYTPYGECFDGSSSFLTAMVPFPWKTNSLVGAKIFNLTRSDVQEEPIYGVVEKHDAVRTVFFRSPEAGEPALQWSANDVIGFELNTERFLPSNMEFDPTPDPIVFESVGGTRDGDATIKFVEKYMTPQNPTTLEVDGLTGWVD